MADRDVDGLLRAYTDTATTTPAPITVEPKAAEPKVSSPAPKAAEPKSKPKPKPKAPIDAVAEASGTDQPWREKMREKYGLKKKPGKV